VILNFGNVLIYKDIVCIGAPIPDRNLIFCRYFRQRKDRRTR